MSILNTAHSGLTWTVEHTHLIGDTSLQEGKYANAGPILRLRLSGERSPSTLENSLPGDAFMSRGMCLNYVELQPAVVLLGEVAGFWDHWLNVLHSKFAHIRELRRSAAATLTGMIEVM